MKKLRLIIVVAFALLCSISLSALSQNHLSVDLSEPHVDNLTSTSIQIERAKARLRLFFIRTLYKNGHDCQKIKNVNMVSGVGANVYFVYCEEARYTIKVFSGGRMQVKKSSAYNKMVKTQ